MNNQASRLVELLSLRKDEKETAAKIISVCSGKGGTGKTFFALNFAYSLASMGKKVLLADLDFNLSNLHLLLNETSENPISEFFEQKKFMKEIIVHYTDNLDLIYGDSGTSDFPRISKDLFQYFFAGLTGLADNYDFIILDSAAGASDLTVYQLLKSDYNILVTSPEPTAVMDAYVIVKLLSEKGSDSKILALVNKSGSAEEGKAAFHNLSLAAKHFLKKEIEFLGSLEFSFDVHKSIVGQELLLRSNPGSPVSHSLTLIGRTFLNIAQVANNNHVLAGRKLNTL